MQCVMSKRRFSLLQYLIIFVFSIINLIDVKKSKMDFKIMSDLFQSNKRNITQYQLVYRRRTRGYFEGYSRGYPHHDPKHNQNWVSYGCWFKPLEFNYEQMRSKYKTSNPNIMIDIGNNLYWRNSTEDLYKYLNLTTEGCLTDGYFCMDKYICTRALAMGYNSINFLGITAQVPELIVCDGQCATESFLSACPPMELKQFVFENYNEHGELVVDINNSSTIASHLKRCICDYSLDVKKVNCDGIINETSYCDHVIDDLPLRSKVSHVIEGEWSINIGFTSNILSSAIGLRVREKFKEHLFPLLDNIDMYLNSLLINYELKDLNNTILSQIDKYYLRLGEHNGQSRQSMLLYNYNANSTRYSTRLFTNRDRYPYSGAVIPMKDINLGVIIMNSIVPYNSKAMSTVVRWIIDESMCLRRKYADIVIVVINCEPNVLYYLLTHMKLYVNFVVSVAMTGDSIASENDRIRTSTEHSQWQNSSDNNIIHVQLTSESNLGIIHLRGNNQSFRIRTELLDV